MDISVSKLFDNGWIDDVSIRAIYNDSKAIAIGINIDVANSFINEEGLVVRRISALIDQVVVGQMHSVSKFVGF